MRIIHSTIITLCSLLLIISSASASLTRSESIKVTVLPFENKTGDPSLDWISLGLQNAITSDIRHLKGFETPGMLDWMALVELKLPSLGDLGKMSHDEQIEFVKRELKSQVLCLGAYSGNSDRIKVDITLVNTWTKQIILNTQVETPLNELLRETSKDVLVIAQALEVAVPEDEKQRVLSSKTKYIEAWRLHAVGYGHLTGVLRRDIIKEKGQEYKFLKAAEEALTASLALDPDYAEAWNDLGYRYALSFDSPTETENAFSAWNRSLRIKEYLSEAKTGLLLALIEKGDFNGAFNYAIKAAESDSACHITHIFMYRERILHQVELTDKTYQAAKDTKEGPADCRRLIGALFLTAKKDLTGVPTLMTLLNSTNEDIRIVSASELIRAGNKAGFTAMEEILKDSRTLVKKIGSEMIDGISSKSAVPFLIKTLEKSDSNLNVWMDTIKKIIELGNRKDVPALIELLEGPNKNARLYAAVILVLMGHKIDEKTVITFLKAPDEEVKAIAAELLGYIGTKTAVTPLIETLRNSDNRTFELAAWSLSYIDDQSVVQAVIPALIGLLQDPDQHIRAKAAFALGLRKDITAVPALLNLLQDPGETVRRSASVALSRIPDRTILPALIDMLKDPDENVRSSVLHAIEKIGDNSAVPMLMELLANPDRLVRSNAVEALGNLRDKMAVQPLIETLKDPETDVRLKAIEALGKTGDRAAIPALLEFLEDPYKGMHKNENLPLPVVRLRSNGSPAPLEMGGFEGEPYDNRLYELYDAVIEALGKIGDPSSVPALIKFLKDSDKYVRYSSISSLNLIKDGYGVEGLIEALKDSDKVNRYKAAIFLAGFKEESAIPVLLEAINDKKYKYSQVNAAEALLKFGNKAGVPLLVEQLQTLDNEYEKRILDLLIKQGEKEVFYKRLSTSSNIVNFNIVRNNLIFVDSFEQLINSHDVFLRASGYYLSALRAREEGRYRDQIEYADKAFKEVNPGQDTGIAILSLWLKAQAELKLNVQKDMMDTIRQTEGLLEYLSRKDIEDYNEPFAEYTLFLKGEIYTGSGDAKSAINVYEGILEGLKDKLRLRTIYYKSGVRDSAQRLEAMVRTSLGALQLKTGRENLEKAVDIGRNYQAADRMEMDNEEKRYLELAKQRLAEGDYEESQKLIEELNLRRTQYVNRRLKLNLSDPDKKKQVDEYTRRQDELDALSRRIQEAADKKGGRGGLGMMTPDPKTEQELSELQNERDRKRRDLQLYLTKLKKTHPDVVMLLGTKPIELATLQEQLPQDAAVLQYLILSDKLIVFVIKNDGIDIIEKQVQSTDIRAKVEAFREEIKAITFGKRSAGIRHLSLELYDILLKPVEDRGNLKGIKFLGIVPNSFLHYLPFGMLMEEDGEQKRYLMERYDLFYINSTSMLWVALDRAKQKKEEQPAIIAFSNPDHSLRYADIEVDNITGLFGKKKIYRHEEARKEIMKSARPENSVLHLSTHAVFNPADSTKSFLLMADSNLTVEDIWGLPLKGTTLTTLSACETGIGEILSGDDVVSLENAFIFAGSPAVISTLWKVEDRSTAELMQVFYENLLKGKTKAEALTEAQRQIKERYKNPFYWAAFTLRGDWR